MKRADIEDRVVFAECGPKVPVRNGYLTMERIYPRGAPIDPMHMVGENLTLVHGDDRFTVSSMPNMGDLDTRLNLGIVEHVVGYESDSARLFCTFLRLGYHFSEQGRTADSSWVMGKQLVAPSQEPSSDSMWMRDSRTYAATACGSSAPR